MKKAYKTIVLLVMAFVLALPCVISPVWYVKSATKSAKIHSLVPKAEEFYPGIENYIAKCLRQYKTEIDVSEYYITTENIPHVFKSAVFTNPDIFYVDASHIRYKFYRDYNDQKIVYYIYPDYTVKKSKIPSYIKTFNKAVNNFMSGIDSNLSDFKKALLIHDKLVVNCRYNKGSGLAYTAYGALVNKKAVCEGYTRAYCYLLSKAGVESKCINIDKKNHCWNYVKINNKWYHVDVTSDDPSPDTGGYVSHRYFLVSDYKLGTYNSYEHKGYTKDITYKSDYKCISATYNSSFFRSIKSRILFYNNSYYYINNNYAKKHYSAFIARRNNKSRVIKLIKDKWYGKGNKLYINSFSKLCYLDGYVYFNSKREIYRYKLSSGKLRKIFTMPDFWYNDFYGLQKSGRNILADKKKSESSDRGKSKVLYIRSNNSVFILPYIRKTSITISAKKKYSFKVYKGTGKVKYKSSNPKVAKVTSKGTVIALKKGTCTVTAVKNNKVFKLKVKVTKQKKEPSHK